MSIVNQLVHYLNLDNELDEFDEIHSNIEKGIVFKGTNLWILVFAIIMASVGLNMNSTAVIIGAMLISPLMGPINGMGYSIATFNFELFRRSVKNFSFAVFSGLIASTAYFLISPVSTAHSELLARTSPTIYDVIIAFFGGLAGIIAISSKLKGNVIPGVAIATALMPPLCTAGYGLATAQFAYFFGALYLFTINTVFIALSSVAIAQLLKFPITTIIDPMQKKKVNRSITMVIVITIIPSLYFGFGLVQKEKFLENANNFIKTVNIVEGNYLMKYDINAENKSISLVYLGNNISQNNEEIILDKAKSFSLEDSEIAISQGFSVDEITNHNTENENFKIEINRLSAELKEKNEQLNSINNKAQIGKQLFLELNSLYPQINSCSYSESNFYRDNQESTTKTAIIVIKTTKNRLTKIEKTKIQNWLKERNSPLPVKVYFEEE